MRHSIDTPTPVLTVTTRMPVGGDVDAVITEATAALRETSRRLELEVFGSPLRVDHSDASVIEVCVLVRSLPDVDPPPPVAAEMLTPGTVVDSLDVD